MYESGYYPAGAEFDPRAPWNERESTMVECAACGGKGYHWYAYDFEADYKTECSEETWNMLPETEEEAIAQPAQVLYQGRKGDLRGVRW